VFLGFSAELLTGLATTGLLVVAISTAIVGIGTYRAQVKEKRGRWLTELTERFSSDPSFRRIRADLYNEEACRTAEALRRKARFRARHSPEETLTAGETSILVDLDNYLGFFELIHHLVTNREMTVREATALFSWYLDQVTSNDEVSNEIRHYFEPVNELASMIRKEQERAWAGGHTIFGHRFR
jgi:hypothetical protein